MRFERAIYADGFDVARRFELGEDFRPLRLELPDKDTEALIRAAPTLTITDSSFDGLALTTTERTIEQELIDDSGLILTGRKQGWYLLGCRAMRWQRVAGLRAEFYVMHVVSGLFFTLDLDRDSLSDYRLESQFERVIDDLLTGKFNK